MSSSPSARALVFALFLLLPAALAADADSARSQPQPSLDILHRSFPLGTDRVVTTAEPAPRGAFPRAVGETASSGRDELPLDGIRIFGLAVFVIGAAACFTALRRKPKRPLRRPARETVEVVPLARQEPVGSRPVAAAAASGCPVLAESEPAHRTALPRRAIPAPSDSVEVLPAEGHVAGASEAETAWQRGVGENERSLASRERLLAGYARDLQASRQRLATRESRVAELEKLEAEVAAAATELERRRSELAEREARLAERAAALERRARAEHRAAAESPPVVPELDEMPLSGACDYVLLVPSGESYTLAERHGIPPAPGFYDLLAELGDGPYEVTRIGPSPRRGDPRPCVYLNRG
jgi:hypothetical protein